MELLVEVLLRFGEHLREEEPWVKEGPAGSLKQPSLDQLLGIGPPVVRCVA